MGPNVLIVDVANIPSNMPDKFVLTSAIAACVSTFFVSALRSDRFQRLRWAQTFDVPQSIVLCRG